MLDLARTGCLGAIHCGLSRDELRGLLGDPPNWGAPAGESWSRSKIWRYGDVEFHFLELPTLWAIYSDHEHLADGGDTLILDPWIVQKEFPRTQFELELARAGIDFRVERPAHDPNERIIVTAAHVEFLFMEEYEEGGPKPGLFAWSVKEPPSAHA